MAAIPKLLARGYLANSLSDLYVVPVGKKALVKQIIICNLTAVDRTFTIRNAGVGAEALFEQFAIPAYTNHIANVYIPMLANEALEGSASTFDVCSYWITGDELTLG